MKFLTFATLAAAAMLAFASPAFAASASQNDGWNGTYKKSTLTRQSGKWLMSDRSKGGPQTFDECKSFSGGFQGAGWYCRMANSSLSGGNSGDDTDVQVSSGNGVDVDLSGPTKFAVFKTKKLYNGKHNAARLNNGTSSNVALALERCAQAGSNCIIVEAEGPEQAFAAGRALGWPM